MQVHDIYTFALMSLEKHNLCLFSRVNFCFYFVNFYRFHWSPTYMFVSLNLLSALYHYWSKIINWNMQRWRNSWKQVDQSQLLQLYLHFLGYSVRVWATASNWCSSINRALHERSGFYNSKHQETGWLPARTPTSETGPAVPEQVHSDTSARRRVV